MLGLSYRAVLPGLAKEVYRAGPEIMGWLALAAGLGALTGAALISALSKNLRLRRLIIVGCVTAGISLMVFATASRLYLGIPFLFLAGLGYTMTTATSRAVSQVISDPAMRGRVTGLTMAAYFGGMALGNFVTGRVAESFGCPASMAICGVSFLMLAFSMFALRGRQASI
ncbi:MAG: MFS transporter [Candidatus Staskawiczbacteria bacterium]|jgi:predicted MFS family arabinose efflux permease